MNSCGDLFTSIGFILKLIEMLICLVTTILWGAQYEYVNYQKMTTYDMVGLTTAGYLIITLTFVIVYIFDETHHVLELILFSVGAILAIIAGALVIVGYSKAKKKSDGDVKPQDLVSENLMMIWLNHPDYTPYGTTLTIVIGVLILCNGIIMLADVIREWCADEQD